MLASNDGETSDDATSAAYQELVIDVGMISAEGFLFAAPGDAFPSRVFRVVPLDHRVRWPE